jgi:hypothetical protein
MPSSPGPEPPSLPQQQWVTVFIVSSFVVRVSESESGSSESDSERRRIPRDSDIFHLLEFKFGSELSTLSTVLSTQASHGSTSSNLSFKPV